MSVTYGEDIRTRLQRDDGLLLRRLADIFGPDTDDLNSRFTHYTELLTLFDQIYDPQQQTALIRAPARINLKGVHVDHRGGYLNYMAINREVVMVVSPRDDDLVVLHDEASDAFGARQFYIGEALPPEKRGQWQTYIEQVTLAPGDWSNYIRAAVLRLQDHFKTQPLCGMNLLVASDIPIAAGLSSSSALVVAACEACLWVNGLSLTDEQKAILCGEGEWYVGTRGGSGDHAAMIFGKRNHLVRLRFFPLETEAIPMPSGYKVVVCNSLKQSRKASHTKSTFNERIATYEMAMLLLKDRFPKSMAHVTYLRDLDTDNIGIDTGQLYRLVTALPERASRHELMLMLSGQSARLQQLFHTHQEPRNGYRVRAVCLFGLAECARSRMYAPALQQADMKMVGKLMYLSHDGDRAFAYDAAGHCRPWDNPVNDTSMQRLIDDVESGDPAREAYAQLWKQPGGYACSCEELDHLVDIARTVPGVVGANLTGAGLGGCVLVLVREEDVDRLIETVHSRYYHQRNLQPAMMVCSAVGGAGRIW
ncbi:MAG: galactokinase family protein [Gemmatimonadota bacterium]|nr:galactokinase family protein [Gemmatimonadota bacterium]